MSGVGSTNAMKKGSGNNPFLAYSKADMRSFLNSAYTGCIVKYTGPSTKVEVLTSDKNKDAQHLVFDITKPFTRSDRGLVRYAMKIDKMTDDGVKTTYICHKWINKLTGRLQNGLGSLDESEYWVYALIEIDDINFDNIKGKNVKFLAVTESLSEIPSLIDLHQDWPTTKGINGWQTNCVNEAGKITLWSYSEDVKYSYAGGSSVGPDEMIYYEPYVVNELYEVVYGNGRYYFEEYYHISDDVTTATVEDVARGKTFYDFIGTKQTGTGTKINPYLATDIATFKSFPVGSFIKWIGPNKTVLDETTGQTLIQGEVYRAVEDGDVFQYVILPTLSNPGTATDLAQGKQLIDGDGKVVEGAAPTQGDVLALYANKQLTEFITDAEISTIGVSYAASYVNVSSFTLAYQSLLSKVVLTNVKTLYPDAFAGCSNLTHIELPSSVNLNGVHYFNGYQTAGRIFPSTLWYSSTNGTFIKIANWSKYAVLLSASTNKSDYSSAKYILAGALASSYTRQSTLYLSGATSVNSYVGGSYGNNNVKTIYMPNCSKVIRNTFYYFSYLDTIYLDNAISIGNAFPYCSRLKKVYCPNVESLDYAFMSSPNLTEPYDFPNVKYCNFPYASSVSAISSVNLPEASVVRLSGSGIQSVYMPKVEVLALCGMQFSSISVSLCRELQLENMSNLENIYAPNLSYCSYIRNCYKLTEISFESVIAASSSYTYNPYPFSISNCSQLKTISLPNFSIGGINIANCSNLETVYVPLLNTYISIFNCTLAQFSMYNAYSASLYSVTAKSDFSIYVNESTFSYLYLGISAKNSERVDLYINNYSRSAYLGVSSIASNAIRNINISIYNNSLRGALSAGEHINIYNTDVNYHGTQMYLLNNSTVLDVKLSNCTATDYFCYNCSNLEDVYTNNVSAFYGHNYNNCSKLSALILDGSSVTLPVGVSVFSNSPITNSTYLGYYGSIYVRNSMVDRYKAETVWKSYASRITSITDLPQELKDKYGLNGVE